jgi:hypothetical protein
MSLKRYTPTIILLLAITFGINHILVSECIARSVYVVSDTGTYSDSDSYIRAYKIEGDSLVYQTQHRIVNENAIGIAIDTISGYMFVTFEQDDRIYLVNTKTMEYVDTVTA